MTTIIRCNGCKEETEVGEEAREWLRLEFYKPGHDCVTLDYCPECGGRLLNKFGVRLKPYDDDPCAPCCPAH